MDLGFCIRRWPLEACLNFTFPDDVIEKRFLALLFVFIFGISISLKEFTKIAIEAAVF
jgi:hypothetical protein